MSKLAASKTLVHTARITVPTVVDAVLGRIDPDTLDQRLVAWAQAMLEEARITLVVRGREHLGDGHETFILMSNHQSHFDIPVLYRSIPRRIRMVAKAELFRIPLFGRAMVAGGFVKVDRHNHQQAVQSLRDSASMLDHGTFLWIAPEGTRSYVPHMRSSFYYVAVAAKVPVALGATLTVALLSVMFVPPLPAKPPEAARLKLLIS